MKYHRLFVASILMAIICFVAGCGSRNKPTTPGETVASNTPNPTPSASASNPTEPITPKPTQPASNSTDNPLELSASDKAKIEEAKKLGANIKGPEYDSTYTLFLENNHQDVDLILKTLKGVRAFGVIDLSGSSVTDEGLRALEGNPYLRILRLKKCEKVTGIGLEPLSKGLRKVDLELNCYYAGINDAGCKVIATIPKVWHLDLEKTKITDEGLAALSKLDGLQMLALNYNPITGTGFQPKGWLTLERISAGNTELADKGLEAIADMPALKRLQADRTKFTDAGVKHLGRSKSLTDLYLNNTELGDAGLAEIGKIPTLKELHISSTPITGSGFAGFSEKSPLKELFISFTKLDDAGSKHLSRFSELTELDMTICAVTDKGLVFLKDLKKLKEISLNSVDAGDATMMLLGTLPELEKASLERTKMTDEGLKALMKAPKLKSVNCRETKVTKKTVDMLSMQKNAPSISSDAK